MKLKVFSGFQLKMLMAILMVVDHIGQFIPGTPIWFRYLGRIVAPIFFFMLVEGFIHTSNRQNYFKRLCMWGLVMFCGSRILEFLLPYDMTIPNNIFFSLASCFALLYIIDLISKTDDSKVISKLKLYAALVVIIALFTEASFLGIGMILIFYYFRNQTLKLSILYIILSSIFILGDFSYESIFLLNYQWMMVFALPFMLMYNGKRGMSLKYFFYVFYPTHIWALYIIGYFLNKQIG